MRLSIRQLTTAAALAVVLAANAACSAGGGGGDDDDSLTVWTLERQPDRVAVLEAVAAEFTEETGVDVRLVPVDEPQYSQLLMGAAAAGELPDVVGGSALSGVWALQANDLIDLEATAAVMEELDPGTFAERALELTSDDGQQIAIPSDAWASVLVYRKDLFDAAGLAPPTDYESILKAAETLDSPDMAGFVGFTTTQETFEHLAMGNDCELTDDSGDVTLDSSQCVDALGFYGDLMQHSVVGAQDVQSVRATYLAGQASMMMFSSFILDELAGLVDGRLPTCDECERDTSFLAKNSDVVMAIEGPDGSSPGQLGQLQSWSLPVGGSPAAADFVTFMMNEGYERWFGFAPEGKVPARSGTPDEPTKFIDAWDAMSVGVDTKAPLSDFYSEEVIAQLRQAPSQIELWGVPQGQGALVGGILAENPVGQTVSEVVGGEIDPDEGATRMADQVRSIQGSMQ